MRHWHLLLWFTCILARAATGQVEVVIVLPVFSQQTINQAPELEQIFADLTAGIQEVITLYATKPQLLSAFSAGNGFCTPGLFTPITGEFDYFAFSLGSTLGVQLFTLKVEELVEYFTTATFEDDPGLGGAAQPLMIGLSLPLHKVLPAAWEVPEGPALYLSGGYFGVTYGSYQFRAFNLGLFVNGPVVRALEPVQGVSWYPLLASVGFAYLYNRFSMDVPFSSLVYPVSIGIFSGNVILDTSPRVDLVSGTLVLPFYLTTRLDLGWMFHLQFGYGIEFMSGKSSLNPYDETEIQLTGDLADYLVTPGSLSLSGEASSSHPQPLRLSFAAVLGLQIDPVQIQLPILYYFNYGLCLGLRLNFRY